MGLVTTTHFRRRNLREFQLSDKTVTMFPSSTSHFSTTTSPPYNNSVYAIPFHFFFQCRTLSPSRSTETDDGDLELWRLTQIFIHNHPSVYNNGPVQEQFFILYHHAPVSFHTMPKITTSMSPCSPMAHYRMLKRQQQEARNLTSCLSDNAHGLPTMATFP